MSSRPEHSILTKRIVIFLPEVVFCFSRTDDTCHTICTCGYICLLNTFQNSVDFIRTCSTTFTPYANRFSACHVPRYKNPHAISCFLSSGVEKLSCSLPFSSLIDKREEKQRKSKLAGCVSRLPLCYFLAFCASKVRVSYSLRGRYGCSSRGWTYLYWEMNKILVRTATEDAVSVQLGGLFLRGCGFQKFLFRTREMEGVSVG